MRALAKFKFKFKIKIKIGKRHHPQSPLESAALGRRPRLSTSKRAFSSPSEHGQVIQ